MNKKKNDPGELDMETRIADMNVDGMPRFSGDKMPRTLRERRRDLKASVNYSDTNQPPLSDKESMHLILNAVVAAAVIGLIFIAAAFLFILFCRYVWFR